MRRVKEAFALRPADDIAGEYRRTQAALRRDRRDREMLERLRLQADDIEVDSRLREMRREARRRG